MNTNGRQSIFIIGIVALIVAVIWFSTKNLITTILIILIYLIFVFIIGFLRVSTMHLETTLSAPLAARLVEFFRSRKTDLRRYLISLSHPKKFSKRYTSSIYVNLYFPENRREVETLLELAKYKKVEYTEKIYSTLLQSDMIVKISLSCPVVEFSQPVVKKLDKEIITTIFVAKPLDDCHSGKHTALIAISDNKTSVEYFSMNFEIDVVDFAFDHVSRPLLANISSVVLGIGSLASFILATIGKLDTALGLTAGTTAGIIAATIQAISWNVYNRSRFRNLLP